LQLFYIANGINIYSQLLISTIRTAVNCGHLMLRPLLCLLAWTVYITDADSAKFWQQLKTHFLC